MSTKRSGSGFTLIEIIIVVAIFSTLATISAATFINMNKSAMLRTARDDVYGALSFAREHTLASENDMVYGVHLSTSSVTRFAGSTYTAGSASNVVYTFGAMVSATSTLITQSPNILFKRLIGTPSATGTIFIRNGVSTTTVQIHGSGLVEYE